MHEMAGQYLGRGCALQASPGVRDRVRRSPIDMGTIPLSKLRIVTILEGGIELVVLSDVVVHPRPIDIAVMNGGDSCHIVVATWSSNWIGIRFRPDRCERRRTRIGRTQLPIGDCRAIGKNGAVHASTPIAGDRGRTVANGVDV